MTPNPILKVLSTFKKHSVKSLLIGGQACIIYGAAEFSRDSDFVILCDKNNLKNLRAALRFLKADLIYVPPLDAEYLERGHACHFRCMAKDVKGLRIDIISKLRGCDDFYELWRRRKSIKLKSGMGIDVIGLRDLVQSKKTQRDKDWLMLKRIVNNDILPNINKASGDRTKWWFLECRDPNLLIELAKKNRPLAKDCAAKRTALSYAIIKDSKRLEQGLHEEEQKERQEDIEYWTPLRKELEGMRHKKARGSSSMVEH